MVVLCAYASSLLMSQQTGCMSVCPTAHVCLSVCVSISPCCLCVAVSTCVSSLHMSMCPLGDRASSCAPLFWLNLTLLFTPLPTDGFLVRLLYPQTGPIPEPLQQPVPSTLTISAPSRGPCTLPHQYQASHLLPGSSPLSAPSLLHESFLSPAPQALCWTPLVNIPCSANPPCLPGVNHSFLGLPTAQVGFTTGGGSRGERGGAHCSLCPQVPGTELDPGPTVI